MMFDGFKPKTKTVTGVCKCGNEFEYTLPAGVPDPVHCGPCVAEQQGRADAARLMTHIDDYANDCGVVRKYRYWDEDIAHQLGTTEMRAWLLAIGAESAWIGGTNGIGKTHTVAFCAYYMMQQSRIFPYLVRASSWLREVVSGRSSDRNQTGESQYRRAITTKLLILDDIGKENLTQARAELLYDIIDERDRRQLPVWITTNFSGDLLRERLNADGEHAYGDAILKRLKRMIPLENIWKPETGDRA